MNMELNISSMFHEVTLLDFSNHFLLSKGEINRKSVLLDEKLFYSLFYKLLARLTVLMKQERTIQNDNEASFKTVRD